MVTGARTGTTLLSALRISLAFSHILRTSSSIIIFPAYSPAMWPSKSV